MSKLGFYQNQTPVSTLQLLQGVFGSNLISHFDVSAFTGLTDGQNVTGWTNDTGEAVTTTNNPQYEATGINGQPALRMTAGSTASFLAPNTLHNQDYTIVTVLSTSSANTNVGIFEYLYEDAVPGNLRKTTGEKASSSSFAHFWDSGSSISENLTTVANVSARNIILIQRLASSGSYVSSLGYYQDVYNLDNTDTFNSSSNSVVGGSPGSFKWDTLSEMPTITIGDKKYGGTEEFFVGQHFLINKFVETTELDTLVSILKSKWA